MLQVLVGVSKVYTELRRVLGLFKHYAFTCNFLDSKIEFHTIPIDSSSVMCSCQQIFGLLRFHDGSLVN